VSKRFGAVTAVAPVSLEIRDGEWLGLFGRNGSGKTSLLRMLVGLSHPSSGRVLLDDNEPTAENWRAVRAGLGFIPERVTLFEDQTGEKTLRYVARLKRVSVTEVAPLLERVGLSTAATRPVGTYSKGMLQRLNLAQALLGDPRLLVLDEPLSGLDGQGVQELFELLGAVEGRTVVLSSHRLPPALWTASAYYEGARLPRSAPRRNCNAGWTFRRESLCTRPTRRRAPTGTSSPRSSN